MSQLKIRGLEDFVCDSDEAEISDEDEDALQQLPLHKGGGIIRPSEIITKREELLRGRNY